MLHTSQDLFSAFSAAELDIRINLRTEENAATDPEDERYKSASLISASLQGDLAVLNIRVLSVADTARTVIYPLRVSIS
jgi:hypothetical protein